MCKEYNCFLLEKILPYHLCTCGQRELKKGLELTYFVALYRKFGKSNFQIILSLLLSFLLFFSSILSGHPSFNLLSQKTFNIYCLPVSSSVFYQTLIWEFDTAKLEMIKQPRHLYFFLFLITKFVFVFHKEQRQIPPGEQHKYNINISLGGGGISSPKVLHSQGRD